MMKTKLLSSTALALMAALWTAPAHAFVDHDLSPFSGFGRILIGTCLLPSGSAATVALIMPSSGRDFATGVALGAPYMTDQHYFYTGNYNDNVQFQGAWQYGSASPVSACLGFGPPQQNGWAITVYSQGGNDVIYAGNPSYASNFMHAGDGHDVVYGSSMTGPGWLVGGAGNDVVWSAYGTDSDSMAGDEGDDALCRVSSDTRVRRVSGGPGTDCSNIPASMVTQEYEGIEPGDSTCNYRCSIPIQ